MVGYDSGSPYIYDEDDDKKKSNSRNNFSADDDSVLTKLEAIDTINKIA